MGQLWGGKGLGSLVGFKGACVFQVFLAGILVSAFPIAVGI